MHQEDRQMSNLRIIPPQNRFFVVLARAFLLSALAVTPLPAAQGATQARPQTIAHDFLDMEKAYGTTDAHYLILEGIIRKAAGRINLPERCDSAGAIGILREIDALLKEEGFVFRNNLLLSRGLATRQIDCDNYCALYISISETLKIPILPVYAPNHSFLRFCFDDGTCLNWEPTQAKSLPDSWYVKTLRIPDESIRRGVYMKNLERREFLAVEYNNIGASLMALKRFHDALPYFGAAIELYPLFSSAWHNRGTAFYASRMAKEALADLLKACELDPSQGSTHNTLGDIYFDAKEYEKALHEYAASIRLDPGNYAPYYSIGLIMKAQGKEDKARTWIKKSEEIKAKSAR
jgi:tetratricopeptide (TPR) repeat protein